MRNGVHIVSLTVQDFGALTGTVAIEPFARGITVISGPNETGKSTLVAALRAALFERHDAKHQGIRSLQTHGTTNAPEVWVELDIGGERVSLHKRFLVKPVAELRRAGGGAPELGAAAEETMQALLDGRAPNVRGVKLADMGLWGLLWVAQDALAHQDPGESLDEDMRGTLWDVVGRQVGQVMGGKHGEHVRSAVLTERARYFTPAGKETGEYKRAKDRVASAEDRVRELEAADVQVQEIARRRAELAEQQREASRALPTLERERDSALAEQGRTTRLESAAQTAAARHAASIVTLENAEKDHDERRAKTGELEKLVVEVTKSDAVIEELSPMVARLDAEATACRGRLGDARSHAVEAQAAFESASIRLELARRREAFARAKAALSEAVKATCELEEASRRYALEGLEESAMASLEALSREATTLRARLDREGTRVVVHAANGETLVRAVSVRSRVDVPGVGVLEIEPACSGLARAVREATRARDATRELLLSLGVRDVHAARVLREARAESERESKDHAERRTELAPAGLEAMERDAVGRAADLAPLEAAATEAAKVEQDREESARTLSALRIDEAALDRLRELEREVAVASAACDAMGTHLEIVATREVRIRTGGGEPTHALFAGSARALTLTESTTLVIEDVAELRFEPRGRDLAKSRARLVHAERELAEALVTLGVATVNDAATAATSWRRLDAARRHAEERLEALAPRGLPELHARMTRAREAKRTAEERYAEARAVFKRSAELEVELGQNRATKEQITRLEKGLAALTASEENASRRQARVRAVSGPATDAVTREWAVLEPVHPEEVSGLTWEIIPGELEEPVDAEGAEQRLREGFTREGVSDVVEARGRFHAGLALGARIVELRKQLHKLAPEGVDALSTRVVSIEGAAADDVEIEALERSVDASRAAVRMTALAMNDAGDDAETKQKGLVIQERAVALLRATRAAKADQRDAAREKLAALRAFESEEALAARLASASRERDDAAAALAVAGADLEAASPGLLRDEVARAEGALRSWRDRAGKVRDEAVRLDAHLAMAAASGRYDDLQEARPELEQARHALAKIDRDASAARLLAEIVEEAYRESQRLFLAPVLREAAPYLRRLRPGTELRMTRDLKLDKVLRRGAEEDFGDLSGGTREQLSVIVRLALARVMARDKRPLPLILDDTMGWTDDGRFLSMVQILRDASSDLQIILLTCHPSRFQRFQAERSFDLDALRSRPSQGGE